MAVQTVETVETVAALRAAVAAARERARRIALVPTMGALHEGHLSLVRAATRRDAFTVVSIFVNPTQFGPGEDFEGYPRDLAGDRAALAGLGDRAPDLVYAPTVSEMYPGWRPGDDAFVHTTVTVRELTDVLCGASRPGHFDGVCTVVCKLLNQARPDLAFFGRKDFQQLQVIRRMVSDLDMPVDIHGVPIVREPDGVAMSSRNAYLDEDERAAATCLSRGLAAAVRAARDARRSGRTVTPGVLRAAAIDRISAEPAARIDYVDVVDPATLAPPDPASAPRPGPRTDPGLSAARQGGEDVRWLVAVAAYVGPARLIDNVVVGDHDDERPLLDAVGD